ncbi:hypothetical protein [Synechococcus sp. BA-132 BA5]|uniref:hypothetical protein n=1 Tax=Synechococcus sp. BA-132 BA5 TaxID=3110252 RepID=UPI002B1F7260|nr:hypothetical protein [Synechococcus sp. BA-132 BA5]MEA5416365.1 hypothetical protein [Synechococcus sp. BA-132 BA5]
MQVIEHPPEDEPSLEIEQSTVEELDLVDSAAYQVIAKAYATHKGELTCSLMNKVFIPSANASMIVAGMVVNKTLLDELRDSVVKTRLETRNPCGHHMDGSFLHELYDGVVSPESVFRGVDDELGMILS